MKIIMKIKNLKKEVDKVKLQFFKKYKNLMRKALNSKSPPEERAESFDRFYCDYLQEGGNYKNWDMLQLELREICSNRLTEIQKNKFGLTKKEVRKAYFELKKSVPNNNKSFFPVEVFYENSFSLIQKITKGNEKTLEIGFGDYPILVNLLNKKGYSAFGIEPFPKNFDKKKTFKATMKNLPRGLRQKFDLILINMVYSIVYSRHYPEKFEWEIEHKGDLVKKLASLIKSGGYLILTDDLGTIFSKRDLTKYFKIILFEKDVPAINFVKNKVEGFERITLLIKKQQGF